jgi:hypothetical protein
VPGCARARRGARWQGRKFFSLSVSPKEQSAPKAAPQKAASFDQLDDDIPAW